MSALSVAARNSHGMQWVFLMCTLFGAKIPIRYHKMADEPQIIHNSHEFVEQQLITCPELVDKLSPEVNLWAILSEWFTGDF